MRKVFLDDLPRHENGKHIGKINWKQSIGKSVNFIYDDVEGKFVIEEYRNKNENIQIKINYFNDSKWINTNMFTKSIGFAEFIGVKRAKLDENFFEKIDTEEKAYILGFMYADGTVYNDRAKLDLQSEDIQILNDIKQVMNIKSSIKVYKNKNTWFYNENKEKVFYPKKDTARLCMNSVKIAKDLSNNGCFPAKTYTLDFPKENILPQKFIKDFIRGYFDGDGSLSCSLRKSKNSERMHFNMTFTGTYEIVSKIKYYLNKHCCEFVGDIRSRHNNGKNNYTLSIDGNNIISKICEYIYNDCSIKLNRKYEKYILLKKEIERRDNNPFAYNKKPFKLYKNGKYIDTFESARILEDISQKRFGVKLTNQAISACLNKKYSKTNVYKGFTFELIA